MSQENVELARRVFASADPSAFYALFSADIEYDMRATPLPDFAEIFRGREAVLEFFRRYWGTWTDYAVVANEIIGNGNEVFLDIVERGTGRGSGLSFERRWYHVWTLRDGELVRWRGYFDREQALEAVGLSE